MYILHEKIFEWIRIWLELLKVDFLLLVIIFPYLRQGINLICFILFLH